MGSILFKIMAIDENGFGIIGVAHPNLTSDRSE
jgi:hypothetical protein